MPNPAKKSQAAILKNGRRTDRIFALRMSTMNLKIKLLQLPARGNHLIVIASGIIDARALEEIFHHVEEETQALRDCKILIDLDTADLRVEPVDLHGAFQTLAANLSHRSIKMALVSSPGTDADRLDLLRASLCRAGLTVALFDNARSAVAWLSGG